MKRIQTWPLFILFIGLTLLASSCKDSSTTPDLLGDWMRRSDFEGKPRNGAVTFTIGTRVFVGTGYDGTFRLKDLWEFDAAKNTWFPRKEFPGVARSGAVAFTAGGKGYIGTGYDGTNRLSDFWEYDPSLDTWKSIAELPAASKYRFGAVALSLGNKGFVGAGFGGDVAQGSGSDLKDWWSYEPGIGWKQEQSIGGSKRTNAFSFVLNGVGYVGGGTNNQIYPIDFWAFDGTSWTQKRDLDDVAGDPTFTYNLSRESAVAFSINNAHAYLVTGNYNSILGNCWEYDPATDLWTEKTPIEGAPRDGAVGFSVGAKGYVTTGKSSSFRFDDIWELDPSVAKI